MNSTLLGMLNGIAKDARTAMDQSTMAILQDFYQKIFYVGTAYDASTTTATQYLQTPPPYALPVAGSYDTQENVINTTPGTPGGNIRLVGG